MDGGESTGALHELDEFVIVACIHLRRNGPARAERNVRGWPTASTFRTGTPADVERRKEAGARRLAARGERGAPAERAIRTERGGTESAGEERL